MTSRTPRTIVPSASLLEALSLCGPAALSIPARGTRRARPQVRLSHLARTEEEIGARLHDDVLALLAIGDPIARLLTGIESTMSIAEAAEDREAPEGHVRIAMVYSDPIGELVDGAHGGPYFDLFAPRAPDGEAAAILVATDGQLDGAREHTLGGFVIAALDEAVGRGQLAAYGTPRAIPLEPAPRLVGSAKPRSQKRSSDRVTHPKFGEGVVISRIGQGEEEKAVVAFAGGERTLLTRFLTPV